ncbi:MAG: NfeD family protein [Anaerolineae bacterium]|nr:NfeD family protein [Anaerolineae bacterium]
MRTRRLSLILTLATALLLLIGLAEPVRAALQPGETVILLEVKGAVTPAMASYFERGIAAGEAQDAAAVLIVLDTPGGATDTMQEIIRLLRNATVPVIVYIGPAGAQAASAGSLITLAAHAAVMAPETVIGAASPVSGEGADIGDTLYRKIVEDLKAQARSLAEPRGPEAIAVAEAMIEEARAVHAAEAVEIGLVDALSPDVAGVLVALDGHQVEVDGQTRQLALAGAQIETLPMGYVEQLLHALSNPLVISILLSLAVPAILIELQSPGGWVAGFIGVTSLALALYGLGQLPVNWLGMGLIAVAFVLFVLEIKAPGIGGLAAAGGITLLMGLLVLFNSPGSPEFARIGVGSAVIVSLGSTTLFILVAVAAIRAMRRQPLTGKEGLVGEIGTVRKTLVPAPSGDLAFVGTVLVHGELWRARSVEAIPTGAAIVVTGMDGFTLEVQPGAPKPETPAAE